MTQEKRAAIYVRVSTDRQDTERQERDLGAFAARSGVRVAGWFRETASGVNNDRVERRKLIEAARRREFDQILVTELTRWGRSTADLLTTLRELAACGVSVTAMHGVSFDLSTPQGKLFLTIMAGLSEFERDLLGERVKSGLANARSKGRVLGRPAGSAYKKGKYKTEVLELRCAGHSIREVARRVRLSTGTVQAILQDDAALTLLLKAEPTESRDNPDSPVCPPIA